MRGLGLLDLLQHRAVEADHECLLRPAAVGQLGVRGGGRRGGRVARGGGGRCGGRRGERHRCQDGRDGDRGQGSAAVGGTAARAGLADVHGSSSWGVRHC
ncbi:hypothetical protein DEH18_24590 [Streptomyces sp. NHF165]|nr:hypothetical protein DEH18_24590 [Streptomyces sp. NHF165]